ncbi:MAG TPA: methionine--tRNA ligase, partial [Thermoanaerobaculia bacterium]
MRTFYATTPIYYVNDLPHIGHIYSTVVTDTATRFHRLIADKTRFLTGTDEHGQNIEKAAAAQGITPIALADRVVTRYHELWKKFDISNDDFIRTTQARHKEAVADFWRRLQASGDIETREYEGLYCVGCEEFKGEDEVIEEGGEKICPIHRKPVERVKEKNYFFNLPRYQDYLLELYQQPGFIRPESRRNEVESFVRGGLKPISASRIKSAVGWGIPVPDDPEHV